MKQLKQEKKDKININQSIEIEMKRLKRIDFIFLEFHLIVWVNVNQFDDLKELKQRSKLIEWLKDEIDQLLNYFNWDLIWF